MALRRPGALLLASLVMASCENGRPSARLESGVASVSLDAANRLVERREQALATLIAATEDDGAIEGSIAPYYDAASVLVVPAVVKQFGANVVADALARIHDERAEVALMRWAARNSRHRRAALHNMTENPSPRYLTTSRELLADPRGAAQLTAAPRLHGVETLFAQRPTTVSLHGAALGLAAAIGDGPARELLRAIAMDASLPWPDPLTLDALRCTKRPGWEGAKTRNEALALSSSRFLALALLGDQALALAIAADPREPPALREWARRMSKLPPRLPTPRRDPTQALVTPEGGLILPKEGVLAAHGSDGDDSPDCR
ncbi:MAG TPA: hypothetical protein VF316_12515 [Polyangiaceae bacterium]